MDEKRVNAIVAAAIRQRDAFGNALITSEATVVMQTEEIAALKAKIDDLTRELASKETGHIVPDVAAHTNGIAHP